MHSSVQYPLGSAEAIRVGTIQVQLTDIRYHDDKDAGNNKNASLLPAFFTP